VSLAPFNLLAATICPCQINCKTHILHLRIILKKETMTDLAHTTSIGVGNKLQQFNPRRLAVALLLMILALAPGQLGEVTRAMMIDAYVQVSVFVAATLLIFYGSERLFNYDIGTSLSRAKHWQVPIAALMGATPGCGGAVVVVSAYASGHVSFGAVVATLTATMGDAAFLLIATRPDAAAVVLPLSLAVGVTWGWIVDRFNTSEYRTGTQQSYNTTPVIGKTRLRDVAYLIPAAPALIVGVAQLVQTDLHNVMGIPVGVIGLVGTALGLAIWAMSPLVAMTSSQDTPVTRMAEETSFISVWVIGAYLAYEYVDVFAGLDLATLFNSVAPLLPLVGVLIGFIPGCGPQVLVTTLYINGLIPFSALVGNAIANDGDALFPAIALSPRAAVMATIWSAVPAVILAYAFYLLAPGFMS